MLVNSGFGAPWPLTGIMQISSSILGNNSPIASVSDPSCSLDGPESMLGNLEFWD